MHSHHQGGKSPIDGRIQKKLLKERKIYLWSQVDDSSSRDIVEKLIYLDAQEPGKDITLYINSPGGSVTAGFAILDAMAMIKSDVSTVVMGMAASFGAMMLTCGTKGKRFAFPHSRVMIHQPLIGGQIVAPTSDLRIHADQIRKTREELNRILSETTGQPIEKIELDTDRDYFMDSKEALEYGIVDGILEKL